MNILTLNKNMTELTITEEVLFQDMNDLLDEFYNRIGEQICSKLNQYNIPNELMIKYFDHILRYAPDMNMEKLVSKINRIPVLEYICEKYEADFTEISLQSIRGNDIDALVYMINRGVDYTVASNQRIIVYLKAGAGRIVESSKFNDHVESLPYHRRKEHIKCLLTDNLQIMLPCLIDMIMEYVPYELLDISPERMQELDAEHKRLVNAEI